MIRSLKVFAVLVAAGLTLSACGGKGKDPNAPANAEADKSAMDQLNDIPKDLTADAEKLQKPIDDVQAALDELKEIPNKHKISAKDLMGMAKIAADGGEVKISADIKLDDSAKAEIEATLNKIKGISADLKATPDKAKALGEKAVASLAKVPVLASKVTAESTLVVGNPLAGADAKAKAQADMKAVTEAQGNITKSIQDIQAKVTEMPAKATEATAKMTAAFSGAGSADTATAAGGKPAAAGGKPEGKDAKGAKKK